jgi:putative ABC transport system substrate-binding protein
MEAAATQLGIEIQSFPMRGSEQLERIFEAAVQARAQAVLLMEDPMIQANRARIVELATRQWLPVMAEFRPFVAAGALMSYGANQVEMWRGAAAYVDRILKGADPATLPIARPIKYELVINLRTSKVLDLAIPLALQVAADEIIE